jgi:flagellar basal-body rod modification protein FlgD
MALSVDVNTISGLNQSSSNTRAVSASVSEDGSSVDSSTSVVTNGSDSSLYKTASKGLSDSDFLLLLMTQLQNQDPSNPMDNTAMMTQMTQLEAVQANTNMEKAIKEMSTSFQSSVSAQQSSAQSMTNATAVSLIGKTVRIKQDEIDFSGLAGETNTLRINLGNNRQASVQILDGSGNVVRTLGASDKDSTNAATVTWEGKKDDGTYALAGKYTIKIAGQESDSSLYAFQQDSVQGVSFSSSGAKLKIAGKELSVANVMDVAKNDETSIGSSLSQSSAIELLGKTVRVRQDSVTYTNQDNEQHQIKVNAEKSSPVAVSVLDSNGDVVAVLKGTSDDTGTATLSWNGQSTDGAFVPAGNYTLKVAGEDTNSGLYCFDEGTVDGINTQNGMSRIRMGGQEISLADIIDISVKSEA